MSKKEKLHGGYVDVQKSAETTTCQSLFSKAISVHKCFFFFNLFVRKDSTAFFLVYELSCLT
jgi:hypothetical protein